VSRYAIYFLPPHETTSSRNHSNFVAQKHAAVTCGVSSSLARIADAEWTRCCESVRKSSPNIGRLGEWRSLCDGGWMGEVPDDLPDTDVPVATGPSLAALSAVEELNSGTDLAVSRASLPGASRDHTPSNHPPAFPSPPTDFDPSQHDRLTAKSDIPALDHFPTPPVHFPLPHLQKTFKSSLDGSVGNHLSYGRQITSVLPTQESPTSIPTTPTEGTGTITTQTPSPTKDIRTDTSAYYPDSSRLDPLQTRSPTNPLATILTTDNTELGIRRPPLPPSGSSSSSNIPKVNPRSSGVVLAMRNRFAQNVSYHRCTYSVQKAE